MYHGINRYLKPRANGRNIVGQQLPTLLDVTCCVRLHTLLHVVGCCCAKFETGQTFKPTSLNISFVPWSPKRSATMLDPFVLLFQHCWGHAGSLCKVYKDLWVVSFPTCTVGPSIVGSCCIRLQTLPTRMQQLPTLLAQQCWELLRPFARSLSGKWKIIRGIKSWYSLSEKIVFYTAFRTNLRYCYVQKSSRKNKSVLLCIRLFTRNLSKSERHILDWNVFHFLLDLLNELVRGWLAWTLIHWAKQEI